MLYQVNGKEIRIGHIEFIGEKLSSQPGNYLLKQDISGEFYLTKLPDFKLPSKIYGDTSIINRWLDSYENNSTKNMGIMLSGLKGAGKTILAQKLCIDSKKPVIMISQAFYGTNFIEFITNPVFNDCIIFIDEFEKIYGDGHMPTDLLSLFDGNLTTRFLFITTVNEMNKVSEYLINRPSRIKYRKHYSNLEKSVIQEVIDDLLINKDEAKNLIREIYKLGIITYDILISIIRDMNYFNESASTVISHFNLEPEARSYNVTELYGNKKYNCSKQFHIALGKDEYINIFRTDFSKIKINITETLITAKKNTNMFSFVDSSIIDENKDFLINSTNINVSDIEYYIDSVKSGIYNEFGICSDSNSNDDMNEYTATYPFVIDEINDNGEALITVKINNDKSIKLLFTPF